MRASPLFLALGLLAGCQCGGSAPVVRIVAPADGTLLQGPGPHSLVGEVSSPGETLGADRITWRSDRDGILAQGASASSLLSIGSHRLTLEATDSKGQAGSAQVSVTVLASGATDGGTTTTDGGLTVDGGVTTDGGLGSGPTATITAPSSGAVFDEGQAITLEGSATDPEEGALMGASLTWTSDRAGVIGTGTRVSFSNALVGTHRIVLTATDRLGNTGLASTSIEVVRPGANRAPVVTLTQPVAGAVLTLGVAAALAGAATDPEDGALSGAALRWTSSRDGQLGTGASVSAMLSQGVHTVTLTATDSRGLTGSASVTVSVNLPNNQAPQVSISSPAAAQSTAFQGTALVLAGSATDAEDGTIPPSGLSWSSSLDGALGTGTSLTTSALRVGDHTLTLVARDSGGNTGTASVAVTILAANQPPVASITAPTSGAAFTSGTAISLSGAASDPEDGLLSGTSLRWSSSRDGSLGTGSPFVTSGLSIGTHTLTLTATDSGGRTGSASISVTVNMGAGNVPPIARLTGPSTGQASSALTFDGATSSDSDGTISSWRFDFGDGSPAQSGTQAQATHAWSAAGNYTVTLTVTDDRGATATATLTLTISAFVRVPVVVTATNAEVGGACSLDAPGSRVHVAWTTSVHPSVVYGEWVNGALQAETVDGLGFGVGGTVSQFVTLKASASGTPHLLYVRGGQLIYATRSGSAWLRERVDTTTFALNTATDPYRPSLALDATGNAVVLYSSTDPATGGYARPAIARRTSPGTWTQAAVHSGAFATGQNVYPVGGLVLDGARILFPVSNTSLADTFLYSVSGTVASSLFLSSATNAFGGFASTALSGTHLLLQGASGLWDVTLEATFSASTFRTSAFETGAVSQGGLAVDAAGLPRLVIGHGSTLESLRTNAGGYWVREELGNADSGIIGVAVDGANQTRACFVRASRLLIY